MSKFHRIYLLLLTFLYVQHMQAQQWTWSLPKPQGMALEAVCFVDNNVGYSVGWGGAVVKTTDGGNNWTYIYCPAPLILNDVFFVTADIGYVVGNKGTILKTEDGGQNWITQSSGTTADLNAIYSFGTSSSIIVGDGGVVIKTINGGTNWTAITTTATADLMDVTFTTSSNGYAVGANSTYLNTTDGGNIWTVSSIGSELALNTISFFNSSVGCVGAGLGKIYYTTNSGANWTEGSLSTSITVLDIIMTSTTEGYAVGSNQTILKTTNGGANWNSEYTDGSSLVKSIAKKPDNKLVVVGGSLSGTEGAIFSGPSPWERKAPEPEGYLPVSDLIYIPGTTSIFAIGNSAVYAKSNDNGDSWTTESKGIFGNKGYFLDVNNGFVVGNSGAFHKTTDGGTSWTTSIPTGTTQDLRGVHFKDKNNGFILGGTSFRYTTDGGNSWNDVDVSGISIPPQSPFHRIYFADATNGFVVVGATLLRTTDGGTTWTIPNAGFTGSFYSFFSKDTIIALNNFQVSKTTDGGTTWNKVPATTSPSGLMDLCFANSVVGYATTINAEILMTTNGGRSWTKQQSPSFANTSRKLNKISIRDLSLAFAINNGGFVLKTTNLVTCKPSDIPAFTTKLTDITQCEGTLLTLKVVSNNTDALYKWTKNGQPIVNMEFVSSRIIPTCLLSDAGTYTIQLFNACGASEVNTAVVTINPKPTTEITGNQTICKGESTTLTAIGADSYSWTHDGSSSNAVTVSPTATQTYSVTGTNNCGTKTETSTVTVNDKPVVQITGNQTICEGESTTLTAIGADSYNWTHDGSATDAVTVSPATTQTYTVTGTNSCGNNSSSSEVTVNLKPVIEITGEQTICEGESTTLTASGADSYTWSVDGATTASVTVSPTTTQTYTVTGTNNCSNNKSVTVTVNNCTSNAAALIKNSLEIYPNPADTELIISDKSALANGLHYEIKNSMGASVSKGELNGYETRLNLQGQTSGIYYLIIYSGDVSFTEKIVLK